MKMETILILLFVVATAVAIAVQRLAVLHPSKYRGIRQP
jgi:hypothetical protein